MNFTLSSSSHFKAAGDQPDAIQQLMGGLRAGAHDQTLLGVTGSGKTFTIANVIEQTQLPTLVIAHNKTLAAQLTQEFRTFFPNNAVEYFVSYYDYYQPEAYLPSTDTYIEKETQINEEIDRLRHAATTALLTRKDVIIVATVSCIYGLGSPEYYKKMLIELMIDAHCDRQEFIEHLATLHYVRKDILTRGSFRVRGAVFEVMPPDKEQIIRIDVAGDSIRSLQVFEGVSRRLLEEPSRLLLFPAKHFVVPEPFVESALKTIEKELNERIEYFEKKGNLLEAERIKRRTRYDLQMIRSIGYCGGIENYSRYLTGRAPGEAPYTLLDYFMLGNNESNVSHYQLPVTNYLMVIDESHVTVPQIRGMYEGDKSRKQTLIEHGFRLPSALDNRPLNFREFEARMPQTIYTSATPGSYELRKSSTRIVEQIVRPTGLIDPEIIVKSSDNQIPDLFQEAAPVVKRGERVLVTTLTKKMAEDLTDYINNPPKGIEHPMKIHAKYLHSDVDTIDRIRILEGLRRGEFDVLVGVNLLREGLDLPEVSLVAILDADQEGFLRSETSLIQTMGRAARNIRGRVILYARRLTTAMKSAISETKRRREKQVAYNTKHHITPKSIEKAITSIVDHEIKPDVTTEFIEIEKLEDVPGAIKQKTLEMKKAAEQLRFEEAALLRDEISQLKKLIGAKPSRRQLRGMTATK